MRRLALALLLVLPLALQSPGQSTVPPKVSASGVVLPVTGPTVCMAAETHYLACTEVYLKSTSGIDLTALEGKLVKVIGTHTAVTCNVIDVSAVEDPPSTLTWCGMPSPTCPVRFVLCPGGLCYDWLFASTKPGFYPINVETGSFLLDPLQMLLLYAGPNPAAGCLKIDVTIPFIPALIGLEVHMQGARQDIGPVGPITLTNAICFTITPFMPPCAPINC